MGSQSWDQSTLVGFSAEAHVSHCRVKAHHFLGATQRKPLQKDPVLLGWHVAGLHKGGQGRPVLLGWDGWNPQRYVLEGRKPVYTSSAEHCPLPAFPVSISIPFLTKVGGSGGCFKQSGKKTTLRALVRQKMITKLEQAITKSKDFGAGMPDENTLTFVFFPKLDQPVFLKFAKTCWKIKDLDPASPIGSKMFMRN